MGALNLDLNLDCELSECDFYPPEDKRIFRSGILDTDGDCYDDFVNDYNNLCEQEELYEL